MAQRVPGRGARPAAQPRGGHAAAVGLRRRAPQVRHLLMSSACVRACMHARTICISSVGSQTHTGHTTAHLLPAMSGDCFTLWLPPCRCHCSRAVQCAAARRCWRWQACVISEVSCLRFHSVSMFMLVLPTLQRGGGAGGGGRALPAGPCQPGGHPAVHRAGVRVLNKSTNI